MPGLPPGAAANAARTIALQMLKERGRGAVLVGVARVDAALEHLQQALMAQAPNRGDGLLWRHPPGPSWLMPVAARAWQVSETAWGLAITSPGLPQRLHRLGPRLK